LYCIMYYKVLYKTMDLDINESQIKKGIIEIAILIILKSEKYGSEIIEMLKRENIDLPEGTLYPVLSRLNKNEYLSYRWQESTGGPPRKYFQITEKGLDYLAQCQEILNQLTKSIKNLNSKSK